MKMARLALRPPFGLAGASVAVRTSRLASKKFHKIGAVHVKSATIWGISGNVAYAHASRFQSP
jgi:hypothetical protein